MNAKAMDRNVRKPVNVVAPRLQAIVGEQVTAAMATIARTTFPTRDAAAKASARVMQPITNRHGVEVGALLFSLTGAGNGPTRVGTPVAGRENCRLSRQCGVAVQQGGQVPGGLFSGYIHSHPSEVGFSDNDLYFASSMPGWANALRDATAYVSLPSGRVLAWSTRALRNTPQASWPAYAKHTVREVR